MRAHRTLLVMVVGGFAIGSTACVDSNETNTGDIQAAVELIPATATFATTEIGQTAAPLQLTIAPVAGPSKETITAISETCADFDVDLAQFHEGQPVLRQCEGADCIITGYQQFAFAATFHPTVAGQQACIVNVSLGSGAQRRFTLLGSATKAVHALRMSPAKLDMGEVRLGTQGAINISLTSVGSDSLTLSDFALSGTGFSFLTPAPMAPVTYPPSSGLGITIVCDPVAGRQTGVFSFRTNDPTHATVEVPIACEGVDSPLDVPRNATVFYTRTNEPLLRTVAVTNVAMTPYTLSQLSVDSTQFEILPGSALPGTTIASGATLPIKVLFRASDPGDVFATLKLVDDRGAARHVPLTGLSLPAILALTSSTDLGPACVGQTTTRQLIALNVGEGDFALTNMAASPPFDVQPPTLPLMMQGNGFTLARFFATVTPLAPGIIEGTLDIAADIPGHSLTRLPLTAFGMAPGVAAFPASASLGAVDVAKTSAPVAVSLSNCSSASVMIESAQIVGDNADEFAIVQQPLTMQLAVGEVASWHVALRASTLGHKTATLEIQYQNGGVASVQLQGDGFEHGNGNAPARATYYACSSQQDGAHWWPLGVVLLALHRRRARR